MTSYKTSQRSPDWTTWHKSAHVKLYTIIFMLPVALLLALAIFPFEMPRRVFVFSVWTRWNIASSLQIFLPLSIEVLSCSHHSRQVCPWICQHIHGVSSALSEASPHIFETFQSQHLHNGKKGPGKLRLSGWWRPHHPWSSLPVYKNLGVSTIYYILYG